MKSRYMIAALSAVLMLCSSFFACCRLQPYGADLTETAAPEKVGLSSERLDRIDHVLKADVENGKIPGAVALIARNGKIAYFKSFGMQVKAASIPMKKDSIFRIYSMTKIITSVAVMMLMEEGKLFLRDPVSKFIPEFENVEVVDTVDSREIITTDEKGNPVKKVIEVVTGTVKPDRSVKIQDLLRHTSGLTYGHAGKSAVKNMYVEAGIDKKHDLTLEAWAKKLAGVPLACQPGTRWEYSLSTDVLGRVIEVASGMTFDEFLENRIFKPLGMKDTAFYVPPDKQDRLAENDPAAGTSWPLHKLETPPNDNGFKCHG